MDFSFFMLTEKVWFIEKKHFSFSQYKKKIKIEEKFLFLYPEKQKSRDTAEINK